MPYVEWFGGKSRLLLLLLLHVGLTAGAQKNYEEAVRMAGEAESRGEYITALRNYRAAQGFDPARRAAIDREIDRVFMTINERLMRVEKAEAEARRQAITAREEQARAEKAQNQTRKALRELEEATTQTVTLLLREIDRHILRLEYESALEKSQAVLNLRAVRPEVLRRLQELAFFFAESGRSEEAAKLAGAAGGKAPASARPALLKAIRGLDTANYRLLQERYYPVMVAVPGGAFTKGAGGEEPGNLPEAVAVAGFKIARTETTVWQYNLFAAATGRKLAPPAWGLWGDNPVVNVVWYDALEYAHWLSKQQGLGSPLHGPFSGDSVTVNPEAAGFRLPTEAEWEYAARGGPEGVKKNQPYAGGSDLTPLAWYGDNAGERTQPVARLRPNALGLYDLSGNVWEWCLDRFEAAGSSDPELRRVVRGGSWDCHPASCRITARYGSYPGAGDVDYGFRVVRK